LYGFKILVVNVIVTFPRICSRDIGDHKVCKIFYAEFEYACASSGHKRRLSPTGTSYQSLHEVPHAFTMHPQQMAAHFFVHAKSKGPAFFKRVPSELCGSVRCERVRAGAEDRSQRVKLIPIRVRCSIGS
jgi:hypothetical protein